MKKEKHFALLRLPYWHNPDNKVFGLVNNKQYLGCPHAIDSHTKTIMGEYQTR